MSPKEPTNSEILREVKVLSGNVGTVTADVGTIASHVNGLSTRVNDLSTHVNGLSTRLNELVTHMDKRFDEHDKRFASIESRMVTRDYLDDKIASLRGELVVLTRREDVKLASLFEELYSENSLSATGRKTVLGMEPFARRV